MRWRQIMGQMINPTYVGGTYVNGAYSGGTAEVQSTIYAAQTYGGHMNSAGSN